MAGVARAVLVSTYDLGHQPFGLASPAAWLKREGLEVDCFDLSKQKLDDEAIAGADLIAFHLPMHTATRMAVPVIGRCRAISPAARLCAFGLYAPLNADWLRALGVVHVLGAEFEEDLAAIGRGIASGTTSSAARAQGAALPKLQFITPDRTGLPPLSRYALLQMPDGSR